MDTDPLAKKAARFLFGLILVLVFSGCGQPARQGEGADPGAAVSPEPQAGAAAETSLAAGPGDPVSNLQDVKQAVLQIRARGTFLDPQIGTVVHHSGQGSGFLIDPSGIAVTDQHVVTGADTLEVWIGGDTSKTYPATVLGVSECSDLALLQISGEGFPYLQWRETPADPSTPIYIAGFNLADSRFSLTKAVISATGGDGNTGWASLPALLQYDSFLDLGSTGGPVVDSSGRVVSVHQASLPETRDGFAIGQGAARDLVEGLRSRPDGETIGINGQLVVNGEGDPAGIWVSAVKTGSPAGLTGLRGGDIIRRIGDLDLTQDPTLAGYCELLRSGALENLVPIQAVRYGTGQLLEGELNGQPVVDLLSGEAPLEGGLLETDIVNPDATAPGERFLSTEFTHTENWYTFGLPENGKYSSEVRNSRLYVQVDAGNSSVYALHKLDLPPDVRVEAAVETVAGPNRNNISLICRATEKGWYEFSMNSGGYWFIWRLEDGEYKMLNSGGSLKIHLQKAANDMMATCVGKDLTLFVNNTLIGSAQDDRYLGEGQVGVSVSTFDIPGAGVEFDWFRASVP